MSLELITGPGLFEGVPEDDYHAGVIGDGVQTWSRSDLKLWRAAASPAAFLRAKAKVPAARRELDLGSAAHQLVLGAGQPIAMIRADSWLSPKTKAAARDERARGRIPLLAHEYQQVTAMAAAVRRNPDAARILEHGRPEVTGYWFDPLLQVWVRIRPDWINDDEVADFKTAESAELGEFARVAFNFGYYLQHPMYLDVAASLGHPARRFRFIVQEKTEPWECVVYELDEDSVELGRQHYMDALAEIAACVHSGDWPGLPQTTQTLRLPRWAFPRGFASHDAAWSDSEGEITTGGTGALDYLAELAQTTEES